MARRFLNLYLFSRTGFDEALHRAAGRDERIRLVTPKMIYEP